MMEKPDFHAATTGEKAERLRITHKHLQSKLQSQMQTLQSIYEAHLASLGNRTEDEEQVPA